MLDKQSTSALLIGVTAGVSVGVGYLLGKRQQHAHGRPAATVISDDEIERLIRPNILQLAPYRCARDDYDQGILLDANENSLGPPLPPAHAALPQQLERYPCPYQRELKQAIADFRNDGSTTKITTDNIFLGVGSDEAIDLIIRVACTPRSDAILITPPTYGMYEVCANIHDVDIIRVPLQVEIPAKNPDGLKQDADIMPSFHIDPQAILRAVTPQTKIIFLCSPGNPTANALRMADIEAVLLDSSYQGFVVVDEAYIDFASNQSLCTLVNTHKRLITLQTLSKGFGLAGIRLGSAFAHPRLIQLLNNVKAPYNINKLTAKVALEAVRNTTLLREKVAVISQEKARVVAELRKLPFVQRIYASDSNFILFQIPHALSIYKQMAQRGVVIRYRGNQLNLKDCLRATIGSPEENERMLQLLVEVANEYCGK